MPRKPSKPMPRPKKRGPQRVTCRRIRRAISERKLPDTEVLPLVYLLITQVLTDARVPMAVAETALEMALDQYRDKRAEDSLSWCNGTPSASRKDQFTERSGR